MSTSSAGVPQAYHSPAGPATGVRDEPQSGSLAHDAWFRGTRWPNDTT